MRFTIFTPTYNRGYIIEKLYHSLQRQSYRDFEWIVVDDGSSDNTSGLFKKFENDDNDFPIYYVKTENGGKHRAINRGVQMASGELFFIVDSDDFLTDDALEIANQMEETIPENQKSLFAGICGQRGSDKFSGIGTTFEGDILDITTLDRSKFGITGDKAEIFYTELLRRYPFPEFDGENFVTECVVWDKIAADGYMLRFFNQILVVCHYLPDGLTSQGQALFLKNPKGYGLYLSQSGKYGKLAGVNKWNSYLSYYYNFRNQYSIFEIAQNLCINPLVFWVRMFGIRLFYKLYNR